MALLFCSRQIVRHAFETHPCLDTRWSYLKRLSYWNNRPSSLATCSWLILTSGDMQSYRRKLPLSKTLGEGARLVDLSVFRAVAKLIRFYIPILGASSLSHWPVESFIVDTSGCCVVLLFWIRVVLSLHRELSAFFPILSNVKLFHGGSNGP